MCLSQCAKQVAILNHALSTAIQHIMAIRTGVNRYRIRASLKPHAALAAGDMGKNRGINIEVAAVQS